MGAVRPWHIIVLVVVLILLFGAKRLPGAARALGRSLRIIKAETHGLVDEPPDDLDEKAEAQAGRRPLPKDSPEQGSRAQSSEPEQGSRAQPGEVVDPPGRVRDR